MIRSKVTTLTLALAVLGVAGCEQWKVARIYKQDDAQLALTLNKDATVTVVGIGAGERVEPCKLRATPSTDQKLGKAGAMPDDKTLAECYPDGHVPGKILFQETYTISVREGSCCADVVSADGEVRVYCSPPRPLGFVKCKK